MPTVNLNRRTFFIFICGLMLSLLAFFWIKAWEENNRITEFHYKASDHAASIQLELNHLTELIEHVRFLVEHDINIEHDSPLDPDDFMPMAEKLIIDKKALLSIAWAVNDSHLIPLNYKERPLKVLYSRSGKNTAEDENDVEEEEYYDEHIGSVSSLTEEPLVKAFVRKDAHAKGNELNFIAPVRSSSQHHEEIIGALIIEWHIDTIIEQAINKLSVASQDITLYLINDNGSKKSVYTHSSRSRHANELTTKTDIRVAVPFEMGGLNWQLKFEAAPNFLRSHPIVLAWPILFIGLLLTIFFSWYTHFSSKQNNLVEQQVIERTQQLTRSEEKFRRIIDNLQDTYYQTDAEGNFLIISPSFEQLSGRALHDVIGSNFSDYFVDQNKYGNFFNSIESSEQKEVRDYEIKLLHQNGDQTWSSINAQLLQDEQGNTTGIEGTIRNIHEHKESKEKLQHLDRVESMGVLAGGIAHDFNNLLTAILGSSALALKKIDSSSPAFRYISAIEEASHSAADLCKQMLAYSGKGKFVIKPINLSELVKSMGKLLEVSLAKNVVLKYHLYEQLPAIDADVAQVQQIVLNLITNASEAIEGKSGVISIATGIMQADEDYLNSCIGSEKLESGRYIYLEISDTGCGMDAETQRKIFDPFFTTKFTGRGLGMSAMLGIVKGHKGAMRIYSEPGRGTTIKVAFRISHDSSIAFNLEEKAASEWKTSGTALIIDDEETVRIIATAMLEEIGFDVITACDGDVGVETFRQHKDEVSLVLLDMTMPNMGGEECFSALRHIQPDVHVILSSGYNEQDSTTRFAGKGLAGFIQKPYTPDLLTEKIQEILEKK